MLPLPPDHRFPMAKYARLRERLVADGVLAPGALAEAPQAAWDDLRLVHDAAYVDAVATGTLTREAQRRIGFPWSPAMVERSRRSVGATVAAARAAVNGGRVAANLAGGTHHAFADRGEGYCVFNDVAVATRVLQREGLARRIAIVDLDVHQGNGTAAIFAGDPSVFTFSMHGAANYPFRKETSTLDVALDDGTGDEEYLALLERHLEDVLAFEPDAVFYLAGADPYEGDRLGRLKVSIDGLAARDRLVLGACRDRDIPAIVTMSGGYAPDVDAIVTIHLNTIRTAAGLCSDFVS
ncbi:MAG: histone deacetylase [Acidobacteriota bacterium]